MKHLAAALLILLSSAAAFAADEALDDPALEARAREISKSLRCVVCQNQSIDDSDADLARDMRALVRERITQGDTDAQIIARITDSYGDFVLLRPPVKPATYALWLGPLIFLAAAFACAALFIRRSADAGADRRPRAAYDLDAWDEQRRALENDLAAGVIDADEAAAARLEIERRIQAASASAAAETSAPAPAPGKGARAAVIAAALIAPFIGLGVYALTGSPGVPGAPYAERDIEAEEAAMMRERAAMIRAMVDGLAARLEDEPDDYEGWIRLERAYTVLGETDSAVYARRRAAEAETQAQE